MSAAALPGRREEAWRWARLDHAQALWGVAPPANDAIDEPERWALFDGARLGGLVGARPWGLAGGAGLLADAPAHPLADEAGRVAEHGLVMALAPGAVGDDHEFVQLGTGGASHAASMVRLGEGARQRLVLSLVDDARADHWANHRLDLEAAAGAEAIVILRLNNRRGLASVRLFARLAESARLDVRVVGDGKAAARVDVEVVLDGKDAEALVNGVLLGGGDAALDARTRIEHRSAEARSSQLWRLVARERAQVSLAGGVSVARHAQQTLADQSLRGLLQHRTAAVKLKPELEILADDVRCAHGCAVGQLDGDQLYYLATRGIPRPEAEALLVAAFAGEALDGLPSDLDQPLSQWLERALP